MAQKKVQLADGRAVSLTTGEVNAIRRLVRMNGKSVNASQHDPGRVRYDTIQNLVNKGVLRRNDTNGVLHFTKGVF